ncbi:MAG: hypothetical protein ACWA5K_08815 [bacterium]
MRTGLFALGLVVWFFAAAVFLIPVSDLALVEKNDGLHLTEGSRLMSGGVYVSQGAGRGLYRWHWCPYKGILTVCLVSDDGDNRSVPRSSVEVTPGFGSLRLESFSMSGIDSSAFFPSSLLPDGQISFKLNNAIIGSDGRCLIPVSENPSLDFSVQPASGAPWYFDVKLTADKSTGGGRLVAREIADQRANQTGQDRGLSAHGLEVDLSVDQSGQARGIVTGLGANVAQGGGSKPMSISLRLPCGLAG